jgi:AcrR family transcriptional regulator
MPKSSSDESSAESSRGEGGRSSTRRDLVEGQIVAEATRLFAERGFSGTSLKDIADATGLTRPAIYHYVRNKDELLAKLVAELAQEPVVALREINDSPEAGAIERLRRMAYTIAIRQAEQPARFQLLIRSESDLSDELAGPYQQGRRDVLQEFVRVIDEGIRAGEMRAVDSRIAALSILGQCNWIAWWHPPASPADVNEHVAESIADLAVSSVESSDGETVPGDGRARALALLKRDVRYLEQVLGQDS